MGGIGYVCFCSEKVLLKKIGGIYSKIVTLDIKSLCILQ